MLEIVPFRNSNNNEKRPMFYSYEGERKDKTKTYSIIN